VLKKELFIILILVRILFKFPHVDEHFLVHYRHISYFFFGFIVVSVVILVELVRP
jgi:hypothetical protein